MSKPFEDEEMLEILESFLIETSEILELLTTSLIDLEKNPDNTDLINKIFRYFHTVKGTSSFMGFNEISKLTHSAEDLLNKIRRNELGINQQIIDVLLDTRDRLDSMTAAITNPGEPIHYDDLVERITNLSVVGDTNNSLNSEENTKSVTDINQSKNSSALDSVFESKELFQGSGDFNEEELALLEQAFAEINNSFSGNTESELKVEVDKEIPKPQESVRIENEVDNNLVSNSEQKNTLSKNLSKPSSQTDTIRIDVKRVESLMDLSGELVLGRNRLAQIAKRLVAGADIKSIKQDLLETSNQIDLITSEIQTSAMKMRMVPIGRLFQKAPKIVRDLSKEFNKKIELVLEGEDTEVDRGIIEELNDPLVHMLRNSCDHGIETAEERLESGKNEKGLIKLIAYHEGNHIIIKVIDDGKGIDTAVILKKAIDKGFVTQEQSKHLSDWEIMQLIFKPGFSTAKNVTSVSGRGVGMDVVKTNINKLKGIIEINSVPGKGSEFIVKLPLTLAIIQGLLVKSTGNIYALPLSSVLEVVSYEPSLVHYVNQNQVIRIRNEVLPLINLDEITGEKSNGNQTSKYVVNIAVGIDRVGLVCEELLGQQEIVIKSLGNYLTNIEGIAGSTIIGDGRVIMILDTQGIIRKYKSKN
jgi:two-component system chemotaxis sensor kinase CheA